MRLLPPLLRLGPSWYKTLVVGIAVSTILSGSIATLSTLQVSSENYLSRFSPKYYLSGEGVGVEAYSWNGEILYVIEGRIGSLSPPPEGTAYLGPRGEAPPLSLQNRILESAEPLPPDAIIVNGSDLPSGAEHLASFRISENGGIPLPSVLSFMEVNIRRLIILISLFGPFSALAAAIVAASGIRGELEGARHRIALLLGLGATPSLIRANLTIKSVFLGAFSFLLGSSAATVVLFSSRVIIASLLPFMTIEISVPLWLLPLSLALGGIAGYTASLQVDWETVERAFIGRVTLG